MLRKTAPDHLALRSLVPIRSLTLSEKITRLDEAAGPEDRHYG